MNAPRSVLIACIRFYQLVLSPWIGRECRFYSNCLQYSIEGIERFGGFKGRWVKVGGSGCWNNFGGRG